MVYLKKNHSGEIMSELLPEALVLKTITNAKEMKETHISYVFLTDDYVYKLKKPVDFGFLDFRLKRYRKNFCLLEKELNDRFSDGIYLEVLKIARRGNEFKLFPYNSTLLTVDYVLKMKRIPDENFLSYRISNKLINNDDAKKIGTQIAKKFNKINTPFEQAEEYGGFEKIKQNCEENFIQTEKYKNTFINERKFSVIKNATLSFIEKNKSLLEQRVKDGYIKDGHGDLRAEHVYFDENDNVGLIDCIEFNKRFRFNDVVSDFVFLCMELDFMGEIALSDSFLEGFFEVFNDDNSTKLVNFYKCYRAFVRAKVTCFLLEEKGEDWEAYNEKKSELDKLIDLSLFYALNMESCKNMIFYGLMGSGKTKNSKVFCNKYPALHLSTDIQRKINAGVKPNDKIQVDFGKSIYSENNSLKLYKKLGDMVATSNKLGRACVVDGSFIKKKYLSEFVNGHNFNFLKIKFFADDNTILKRLEKRKLKTTVSDGRPEIFFAQKKAAEEISPDLVIETYDSTDKNIKKIIYKLIDEAKF
jgi:aminoglycoside phosphotransferase family enzyme/predicted kinase